MGQSPARTSNPAAAAGSNQAPGDKRHLPKSKASRDAKAGHAGDNGDTIPAPGALMFRNASAGTNLVFTCDGIVVHDGLLLAANIAGPGMALKAIRAGLSSTPASCSFDWCPPGRNGNYDAMAKYIRGCEHGYRFSQPHKLGFNTSCMAILAKMPTLIHSRTQETLWQHLEKSTTTPIKREWMDWIVAGLMELKKIYVPNLQHGLSMAFCEADDATLDKLVAGAVVSGRVTI